MAFPKATAHGGGGGFKPVSAGLHPAICVQVIDLGVQEGSERYPKPKHKCHLRFACIDETVEWEKDGQKHSGPAIVGRTFTYSLSENSHLRPLLESWRGKTFTDAELEGWDVSAVAGKPCQVNIMHETRNGKTYANITAIVPWPKGVPVPAVDVPVVIYSPAAHDQAVFDSLPEWQRETINKRLADNYAEYDSHDIDESNPPNEAMTDGNFDDDIPF